MALPKYLHGREGASGKDSTLVLGVGNTLQCDDGLGIRVAEMLANRKLPVGVEVREAGTPGIGLVNEWQGWKRVMIIDATQMGETPGAWKQFNPQEVKLIAEGGSYSLHEPGVAQALQLAEAIDLLPEEVIIYGVEPERVEWGEELSAPVKNALPGLVDKIYNDLWKREE